MKERILQILQDKHLTSAKLADMIQVQRSSISHILSGRNKPSMDFLQKILTTYDDISGDWLITGKGDMYKSTRSSDISASLRNNDAEAKSPSSLFQQAPVKQNEKEPIAPTQSPVQPESTPTVQVVEKLVTRNKAIKRIIIYYSDNSYEELFPSKEPE